MDLQSNTPSDLPALMLEPTPESVVRSVDQAAEYAHRAICQLVGSTQSWRQSTEAHRTALRRAILTVVVGTTETLVRTGDPS